jgi:hypothetical protein
MFEKLTELYNLLHPSASKEYKLDIDRCIKILRNLDSNFNYKNINFNVWKYIILQLPSNIFDYDNLDIIIHPFNDTHHTGYKFQNLFSGDKKYVQYIIPKLKNKNNNELHIFIKDLIYELDSIVIYTLLAILLLLKNKTNSNYMDTFLLCKDKQFDGCSKKQCDIVPINYSLINNKLSIIKKMHNKSKSKTIKNTKKYINDICPSEINFQKIITTNKIPNITINYTLFNYSLCENKLIYNWNKWVDNIYDIIVQRQKDNNIVDINNFNLHVIIGLKTTFKIITKLYSSNKYNQSQNDENEYIKFDNFVKNYENDSNCDFIDKFALDNIINLRYDINVNISGIILPLNQYIDNINKIKKDKIIYDPIFKKYNHLGNTYILCIDNLFGTNAYYMANAIKNKFYYNLKSFNSVGSCGGISNKINLGDIILSNYITCWSNIIKKNNGNNNLFKNIEKKLKVLQNIDINYKINTSEQIIAINKVENINKLIYKRHIHNGKCCTGSIIPYETDELLLILQKNNFYAIEMENFWIKKAIENIPGLFMQYASDLPTKANFKLYEKHIFSKDLYSINISNCMMRTVFAYIMSF